MTASHVILPVIEHQKPISLIFAIVSIFFNLQFSDEDFKFRFADKMHKENELGGKVQFLLQS